MSIHNILYIILLTLIPTLELRASIPYGILIARLPALEVFVIAVVVNILLGLVLFLFLDSLVRFFTRVKLINDIYEKIVARTQRKVEPYVERFGTVGVALFIAVPLPGSGVWTGALAAYLLGLKFRKFALANIVGVLIAAVTVTAISLGLLGGM
ncbi:MAG: small multi-drug export protein [archaeon]|jgi:uncharacterized membrane protein|nr:small multi-drug export protein [archaeon]